MASRRIAILGTGKIGESLLGGLLSSGWRRPDEVVVTGRREDRIRELEERHGVRGTLSNAEAVRGASLVVIAVKPQDFDVLLGEIGGLLTPEQTVLSVAAAIPTTQIEARLEAGVPVALATDFNPGTSPTPNLPLILTLGVSQLRLSVAEAVIAATVNGAAALALAESVGQLAPGFSADLALFEIGDVRELPYWYGDRRCLGTWVRGKTCHPSHLRVT